LGTGLAARTRGGLTRGSERVQKVPPASMVPTRPYLVQQDRKDLRESSAPTPVTSSEAIVLPDTRSGRRRCYVSRRPQSRRGEPSINATTGGSVPICRSRIRPTRDTTQHATRQDGAVRTRPHHRSRSKTTARCHIPTHPPNRPTTPPQTQPCPPTGQDLDATSRRRSPPWLAGPLHGCRHRRNIDRLRTFSL
jgi:hypothetical protein